MILEVENNINEIIIKMETLNQALQKQDVLFSGIKEDVKKNITKIFLTEGYGTWRPLSEKYVKIKSSDRGILRERDNYFLAVTNENHQGNVYIKEQNSMIWGVDLGYFKSYFGSAYPLMHEKGSNKVPARPVFRLLTQFPYLLNDIKETMKKWVGSILQNV